MSKCIGVSFFYCLLFLLCSSIPLKATEDYELSILFRPFVSSEQLLRVFSQPGTTSSSPHALAFPRAFQYFEENRQAFSGVSHFHETMEFTSIVYANPMSWGHIVFVLSLEPINDVEPNLLGTDEVIS